MTVAEGPGHVRDTHLLLEECGLAEQLKAVGRTKFVDLNFDDVSRVPLKTGLTSLSELWLPNTILGAYVLISMPKVNDPPLGWQGINRSILELASAVPIHYVIADAIVAMEGNGPLHGASRHLARLIFSDDPDEPVRAVCGYLLPVVPN